MLSSVVNKPTSTETSSAGNVVPLLHIHSFTQLLENMHRIEVYFALLKSQSHICWGSDTGAARISLSIFGFPHSSAWTVQAVLPTAPVT